MSQIQTCDISCSLVQRETKSRFLAEFQTSCTCSSSASTSADCTFLPHVSFVCASSVSVRALPSRSTLRRSRSRSKASVLSCMFCSQRWQNTKIMFQNFNNSANGYASPGKLSHFSTTCTLHVHEKQLKFFIFPGGKSSSAKIQSYSVLYCILLNAYTFTVYMYSKALHFRAKAGYIILLKIYPYIHSNNPYCQFRKQFDRKKIPRSTHIDHIK